jgi:hypothetical protein
MRNALFLLVLVIAISLAAAAQDNDFAVVAGAKFTPSTSSSSATVTVNRSAAFEASFAHKFKGFSLASLQLEVPIMAAPNATIRSSNFFASKSYNSIYFTPGIRLRFASDAPASPWVAVGGGLARFSSSPVSVSGGNTSASGALKGAVDAGGGLDIKVPHVPVTFRVEAREYFSGAPNLNIPKLNLHNNVFAGAGIVLRF